MSERKGHPPAIRADIAAVKRLEWWHIVWTLSIIVVMGAAMGSSQAMKTAWIEDTLGLVPPIAFLIAVRYEEHAANRRFQYGYDRVNGLGFLIAAVALAAVGLLLLADAVMTLIASEHVSVGSVRIWGRDIWLGWFMLAAQFYATIPPLIIGHKQLPLARRLHDKLVHTDALMNKANWQTGVAGFVGVAGLGFGYWWADSAAAAIISITIIIDGWKALRIATSELIDGIPLELGEPGLSHDAKLIAGALKEAFPGSRVLMRETGRYIRAEVVGCTPPKGFDMTKLDIPDWDNSWRLDSVAFRP